MVSVVMITYGHEKFIKEAIEGVLLQKADFSIELIIANDCSPDKTDKIVSELIISNETNIEISYKKHEANIGMMPNFIFALNQANGKYIAICDGDDFWNDPYKLQKQVNFLESNTEYVLCFHKIKILKPNGELVDDFITKVPKKHQTLIDLASFGNYIHTPSVVFKNILKEFPEEFFRSPFGDFFIYLLLAEHGKLHHIEENMAVYRYGVGVHSTKSKLKMAKISNLFFINYLSYSNNKEVNKVIFEKQLMSYDKFEQLVKEDCNLQTLFENYKQKLHYIFIKIKKKIKTIK